MLRDAVIVEVSGGVVQAVHSTMALKTIVIDHDNLGESANIVEDAAELSTGIMPGKIIQHHEVDSFVMDLIAPGATCGDCGVVFRDTPEVTSINDHGLCIACFKEWQSSNLQLRKVEND